MQLQIIGENRYKVYANVNCSQVHVVFQHYVISNLEKYFPRCREFLPERWLREDEEVRHGFASLPFGYGRRMCLGRRFAELEMIIVISKVRNKTSDCRRCAKSPQSIGKKRFCGIFHMYFH